ncbi:MAG: hypothetical protein KBD21_04975, partial [Candidatus Pacebacteria bacterium]|nr:hypothetical protein [Candidatus Paceibacterota bacterium]
MKKLLTGYIWPVGVVGASIFASAFSVALLTFVVLTPALTYASPHGNAWGYYGTAPGQLKKEFRREGIPGYGSFSDLGSLHEYIR